MKKFIITGTGRCGTGYISAILNACGIKAGHQAIRHEHVRNGVIDLTGLDGDCSYEVVPLLSKLKSEYIIIHVSREKQKVIDSYLRSGVFNKGWEQPYFELYNSIKSFAPKVLNKKTPKEIASAFYDAWFNACEKQAVASFDVEKLDAKGLFRAIGHLDKYDINKINTIPKDFNSH